ncbi:MAG: hypothetical protein ABJT31_12985 [Hyphomicrobiales bacterium]
MSQNQTDHSGSIYQTGHGGPASHGETVKVVTPSGTITGTMQNGSVVTGK